MRRLLALCLLLIPTALSAQEGRIAFSRAVQYDFEVPERWAAMRDQIPSGRVSQLVLLFNASESVMMLVPESEEAAPARRTRADGAAARLRMGSSSRSDQETLLQSYVSFEDRSMEEAREFMGRTFLLSGMRPDYAWSLSGEQREFLGYVVQKATSEHDGARIEAWFTMEIPVEAGPGPYGGLPGVILLVSVNDGHTVYAATDVDLSGLGDYTLAPPDDGDAVSPEEYERIVAEKLEEIEMLRGTRDVRRRRPQ
jgi:GLPGLI family protein